MSPEQRLAELGLTLPEPVRPVAAYVPTVRSGALVFTSGQLPMVGGSLEVTGKVGAEVDAGRRPTCWPGSARSTRWLPSRPRSATCPPCAASSRWSASWPARPTFFGQPQVANGASELLVEVFGDAGRHARSAVGVAVLPLDAPVEVEIVVEV